MFDNLIAQPHTLIRRQQPQRAPAAPEHTTMTKNERRELDKARTLAAADADKLARLLREYAGALQLAAAQAVRS